MHAVFFGPLVPRLSAPQMLLAYGEKNVLMSTDDFSKLMDLWRQERRLVPIEFRSPMERWLRYAVARELRNETIRGE